MKKLIVLTIAIIFAIGAHAQTTKTITAGSPPQVAPAPATLCVATMAGGKMWVPGTGVNVAMLRPKAFPNGITVYPDGHYTSVTGKPGQLKNGDCFDAKGNIITSPPAPVKVGSTPAGSTPK